ncbi:hypothetical protein [Alteromonas stellipolaris]|uniref:hypothetical protein n=1 Tax=Alteromonas stellipolaris TaxID=233316 RepID=UPI0012E74E56|nr:hypothetical protein [Alteromonas stellipolaris]
MSDCCGTQSREHYITKGLFDNKMLYVENAPFLGGESREISKASLTKKCLCKKHNELLSIYDDEAIKFGKSLEYALNLSIKRRDSKLRKFSVHKKKISKELFTRWFIKTYLGLYEFFKYTSEFDESYLASLVYSEDKISDFVTLNFTMLQDEDFEIKQTVSIAAIEKNGRTHGMEIELYGVRIRGSFHKSIQPKIKPLRLKFNEYKQGLSCVVEAI